MKYLSQATDLSAKKALVRADLDISMDKEGKILETFRLDVLIPTLKFLLGKGIMPVIAGHIGRPAGKEDSFLSTERLKPYFDAVLGSGNYELLENLRFNPGENEKDPKFAQELATKADIYVNESFATCHRDTASISLLPKLLPSFVGLHLEEELKVLERVFDPDNKPSVIMVGGAKKSKKETIYALAKYFDYVLVGGALKKGLEDPEATNVFYPIDHIENGLDVGPRTIAAYAKILSKASLIVWVGPMGAYDQGYFEGSKSLAQSIISLSAFSIVGGGDTITCLDQLGLLDSFDFVSTGGGASLDFLSKGKLPGLEALNYYV